MKWSESCIGGRLPQECDVIIWKSSILELVVLAAERSDVWYQYVNVAAATNYLDTIQQTSAPATADKRAQEGLCVLLK